MYWAKELIINSSLFFGHIIEKEENNFKIIDEKKIEIPFSYINEEDISSINQSRNVQENKWTTLKDENDYCIAGPLNPCQLLVIQVNKKTIVAHTTFLSNFENFLKNINTQYNFRDGRAILFTNYSYNYEQKWQKKYQNRSQEEELNLKKLLINKILKLPNERIIVKFFKPLEDIASYGKYLFIPYYVFIKNEGDLFRLYSYCPVNIQYNSIKNSEPAYTDDECLVKAYQKITNCLQKTYSIQNTYGEVDFIEI